MGFWFANRFLVWRFSAPQIEANLMKSIMLRTIFIGAIVGAFLIGPLPRVYAQFSDANDAIKECDKATKDALNNVPQKSIRDAENELDQAEQKLNDVKNDPNASKQDKKDAETARDTAKEAADDAQDKGNPQLKDKYGRYRDALKRRREACKKLKDLIPKMEKEISDEATGKQNLKGTLRDEEDKAAHKVTLRKARECVKKCGEPPTVAMIMPGGSPGGGTFAALVSGGQLAVNLTGTGETIGHVADAKIDNLTDQAINCSIPAVVLESKSGKNQDYVVPHSENVALGPHESKTVPMDGVCVNRHKPPVGKGVGNDLAINDPSGNVPRDEHSHLKRDDSDKLLRIAKSKYDAADKLEDDGQLKDIPYKDKKKRKEIVEQWSTWTDPRISEIEGGPPATKDDLKKVVYKQVPPETTTDEKKKIDKGIDTIFDKIELTTKKAKDLEKPAENEEAESPPVGGGGINVSNDTPTPGAQTQEKKKKIGKNKKKKKWPQPIQDWVDKMHAAEEAQQRLQWEQSSYHWALIGYCAKISKHWSELRDACTEARKKAKADGATQADKDNADKVCDELKKQEDELAKDFNKTEAGQKASDKVNDAQKAADKASGEEKEAGKNIDQTTKDAVREEEKKHPPVQAVW